MKKTLEHGFLDHLLVLIACSSSLFALGESLSKHLLSTFLAVGSAVSVLTGYFVSRALVGKKLREYDGYLWTAMAIGTSLFSRPLNGLLPEDGFPFMLFAGTWLSWMVLLCGLVSWRDQTLLFLNLPCLSIFALVGTFDTFAPATVLFFVFLICSSLLYARIHQRGMLKRAQQAGYSDPKLLERDAWRWVAGPEWAFASAGVIVVLSLVFGPLLRFSLEPVSGTVKVGLPQLPTTNPAASALANTDVQVGRGAILLSGETVFKVRMDRPGYLRTAVFTSYVGNGWSRLRSNSVFTRLGLESKILNDFGSWQTGWPDGVPLEPIKDPIVKELTLMGPTIDVPSLPSPGPVQSVYSDSPGDLVFSPNGIALRRGGLGINETVKLRYLEPSPESEPGKAAFPETLASLERYFTEIGRTPRSVVEFASNAAEPGRTDYERALLLQRAIASAAGYTLKAPAVNPTTDAVEQFLFTTKRGYCDLFATAMVVCARSIGLPARYAIGYLLQSNERDAAGFLNVTGKEGHAWAEVYFQDLGWVKFDATEGAALVPDETEDRDLPWYRQRWALFAFGASGLALIVAAAVWSRTRSRGSGQIERLPTRIAALKLHREFDRAVRAKTGVTRRFSQTTAEYVAAVAEPLGDTAVAAQGLVAELERACFGEAELEKAALLDLGKRVKEFSRAPGQRRP